VSSEGSGRDREEYVPFSVRNARQMRKALHAGSWMASYWMCFASIVVLAMALAILTYQMGAQGCR
jgi:sterol desaturase/sphingolipid hydroxylase (fatty acid hydroxylase superfamily)